VVDPSLHARPSNANIPGGGFSTCPHGWDIETHSRVAVVNRYRPGCAGASKPWRASSNRTLCTDSACADPTDAFDVVVPDMPGYGYSDRRSGPLLDAIAVAGLRAGLMGRPRLRAVRRGGRGHRQPREPLPAGRPPRPGHGRAPHQPRACPSSPATRRTSRPQSAPGSRAPRPKCRRWRGSRSRCIGAKSSGSPARTVLVRPRPCAS
jgi:hypothetical protein